MKAVYIVCRYTTTTQDRKTNPINPKSSTDNFQSIASTAAGVAAGSVIVSKFISQKLYSTISLIKIFINDRVMLLEMHYLLV